MAATYDADRTLDVTGESCPMPVVKTRGAAQDLASDEVLEVLATDSGSLSDIEAWAESDGSVDLLDQVETEDGGRTVYTHYLRKA